MHCDLKPANILLDQDNKPRLADFGQSRLSHEQMPALGTMFYMAPEQADLDAVPDARWDVYALGALLYCMLTGNPPHRSGETADEFDRTPDLRERLDRYRLLIEQSPPPVAHRQRPGVDSPLADIIDRCLAFDPKERYPNVQAVLRRAGRPRRPPGTAADDGFGRDRAGAAAGRRGVVRLARFQRGHAGIELGFDRKRRLDSNGFAAKYIARTAAKELDRRFQLVEQVAGDDRLRDALKTAMEKPEFREMLAKTRRSEPFRRRKRIAAGKVPRRSGAEEISKDIPFAHSPRRAAAAGRRSGELVFLRRPRRFDRARVRKERTVGKNFAWRSYFHGGSRDMDESWRPEPGKHLEANDPLGGVSLAGHLALGGRRFHAGFRRFGRKRNSSASWP